MVDIAVAHSQFAREETVGTVFVVFAPEGPAAAAELVVGAPSEPVERAEDAEDDGAADADHDADHDLVCLGQAAGVLGV